MTVSLVSAAAIVDVEAVVLFAELDLERLDTSITDREAVHARPPTSRSRVAAPVSTTTLAISIDAAG